MKKMQCHGQVGAPQGTPSTSHTQSICWFVLTMQQRGCAAEWLVSMILAANKYKHEMDETNKDYKIYRATPHST